MSYIARNIVLTTLLATCMSSVLASRRHSRHYSPSRHPSYVGSNKGYRTEINAIFLECDTSQWPSNTDNCLKPDIHLHPDDPAWYRRDGQFYDKTCLKALIYLVEPEERAACRTQSDCHHSRGYDNECLIQLSFDRDFNFDFEEVKQQELEWKRSICYGKTLDECGRDHSSWWRSRFPSSRDDCRIHGQVDKTRQGGSGDNWVSWSVSPHGTSYDNDCLSRFANRLGMENPRNCTQTNTYTAHEAREDPPMELPKTLVHATVPSGIQPHLELPTGVSDPTSLAATPVTTYIPTPEDSIPDVIPESFTTGIPDGLEWKRNDIAPLPLRTPTKAANALPTLPPVSRAQSSAIDEWPCMWDVDVTLPNPAPGMFDVAFGGTTIDEIPLVAQREVEGESEDLGERDGAIGEDIEKSLIG